MLHTAVTTTTLRPPKLRYSTGQFTVDLPPITHVTGHASGGGGPGRALAVVLVVLVLVAAVVIRRCARGRAAEGS